jgi:hypothetical protein
MNGKVEKRVQWLPFATSRKASTQKATEMKRANISSVDRVDQRIKRLSPNSEYKMRKNEFHIPTQQYMA